MSIVDKTKERKREQKSKGKKEQKGKEAKQAGQFHLIFMAALGQKLHARRER